MWETQLLESAEDLNITQEEVVNIATGFITSALYGFVAVAIMSMGVKGVYSIIGNKKLAGDEKEVLEMVEEIC